MSKTTSHLYEKLLCISKNICTGQFVIKKVVLCIPLKGAANGTFSKSRVFNIIQ